MAIPGFSAETAVYKSIRHYFTISASGGGSDPSVLPAQTHCVGLNRCCGPEIGGVCIGQCCSPNLQCCGNACSLTSGECCPWEGGPPCGEQCCNALQSCCAGFDCCESNESCTPEGCQPNPFPDDWFYDDDGFGDWIDYGTYYAGIYDADGVYADGSDGIYDDGCFVADTPISTGSGPVPIDAIEAGVEVLAYDVESDEVRPKRVARIHRRESDRLLVLDFGMEQLRCTPFHRFYTGGNWTAAKDLQPGQSVLCRDGHWERLLSVRVENIRQPVFNLEIEDHRNYFVGKTGFLVHNLKVIIS